MNRLTRGGLLALALPTLYGAILLLVPTPGSAALLSRGPGTSPGSIDHPLHLISADFNQDGYDDLVVADFEAGTVTVLINQRDGTFAMQKDSPNIVGAAAVRQPTLGPVFLATGDLNPEDVDGDRVNNVVDNCPNVYNPADATGIQADTDDPVLVGQRQIERRLGIDLIEMAKETQNEMGRDAMSGHGPVDGALQPVDHCGERDASGQMSLGIEEYLDMAQALAVNLGQICGGQVVKILLGAQHRHALIVEVEKILQAGKPISPAQRLHIRIGERQAVARGQREHELRLQGSFDVDMELALGQSRDVFCQVVHNLG